MDDPLRAQQAAKIAFVLLELMTYPLKELPRRWGRVAFVVLLPRTVAVVVIAVSGEMAAKNTEEYHPPEHFNPLWKLSYMMGIHGISRLPWRALSGWGDRLWLELIGILGWQDILLRPWVYVLLSVLLMLAPLQRLELGRATRSRVMIIAG